MVAKIGTYRAQVGTQTRDLPIVPIADDLAIALLITVDHGVKFIERAGQELAESLRRFDIDCVVSVATMGIPVAMEVTRALGLDDYMILQKTPKIHLADAIDVPVRSITTATNQRLLLDRERLMAVAHRRVAIVDDVISTGASIHAALRLLRGVGANPVAIGALLAEANSWKSMLGDDAQLVQMLGRIPLFRTNSTGQLYEDWEG
ncbi:MAG TPA: phosphoribosyltransferase family protein [Acidimicrobiales bacterium]|nr:phosphoribosyltransferase family protein [Acidimicrobiales bacterium]